MILIQSYALEDCKFYDASSSTNVSKYSAQSGTSFNYDSTNSAYSLYPSSSGTRFVSLNNETFAKNNDISIDFKLTTVENNAQIGFTFGNVGVRAICLANSSVRRITISNASFSSDYTYLDYNVQPNIEYTLELLSTGVLNLKQSNVIVATCNYDISSLLTNSNDFKLFVAHSSTTRALVKNIKIKPL